MILWYYCTDIHNRGTNGDMLCHSLAKKYTIVAPDLRGFGDSSKPLTGYDGNNTAEDIYQLMKQLGFAKILLAAHDVGSQTAFSYTANHPNNVTKLVIMDFPFPGFLPASFGQNGPWWFSFYQTPDIPEANTRQRTNVYFVVYERISL